MLSFSPRKRSQILAGFALSGFVAFLRAPAIAQSEPGSARRVEPGDPVVSQQPRSVRADTPLAWVTRLSKTGRDLGFLVEPTSRTVATVGVAAAFGTGVFLVNNRPRPTQCAPPQLDKWQHCFVGCEISSWCPCGSLSGSLLAMLKEIWDLTGHGKFEWADIRATLEGTWDCPASESCEEFCCGQFG